MLNSLAKKSNLFNIHRLLNRALYQHKVKKNISPFQGIQHQIDLARTLKFSSEALAALSQRVIPAHLYLIHYARLEMVKNLLPAGDVILDLGGANSPLNKMGYPHRYSKIILVDLPTEDRHKDFQVETDDSDKKVFVHYGDMTNLTNFESNSIDFVWSGQSIEHVSKEHGKRMCEEAFRVLKSGGHFCLDTPNRLLTELHTATVGGGYIHPEHKIEYTPDQLRQILRHTGFSIQSEWGICEMPKTVKYNAFEYADFILGNVISPNINSSYIQFFHAQKP